jgi:quinol monooxygenase YgiN
MIYAQVRFTVEDIAIWKPVFEEAAALRKSYGSLSAQAFSKADNQNEIMVLLRFESREQAMKMFQSPEFREVTQRGKMLAPPEVTFFNDVKTLDS